MAHTAIDRPTSRRGKLAVQFALLAATLLLLAWRAQPDSRLHVIFLETSGDAALLQTPNGGYVLIDGGGDPAALTSALGRHMPFWRRTLDMVVLTSADSQHLPGQVAALARYDTAAALAPPVDKPGATLHEWRRLLDQHNARLHVAQAGDRLDLGGASLRVLAAGDGDEAGLVLRLDYGVTSVVFDHVGGEADEQALAALGLPHASLLAFPWQRDPRTTLVETLRPRALVFTDGQAEDQPARLMLTERAVGGAAVYHEQLNGAIEWISDGRTFSIVTER